MLQIAHRLTGRVEHRLWAELPGMISKPGREPDHQRGCSFCHGQGAACHARKPLQHLLVQNRTLSAILYTFTNTDGGSREGVAAVFQCAFFASNWSADGICFFLPVCVHVPFPLPAAPPYPPF